MFDKISYIIHFRKDTDLREQNLRCIYDFYKKYDSRIEFIIIEDDKQKKLNTDFLSSNDQYIHFQNDEIYKRTHCFNIASLKTDREILVFGDSDVIIKQAFISRSAELVLSNNLGIMHPYNGLFINIKNKLKNDFMISKNYDILENARTYIKPIILNQTDSYVVFNTAARGGSVMFNHEIFNKINGYNPNFIGWGYEDDEISTRTAKLGYGAGRYNNKAACVWHLDHDTPTSDKRSVGNIYYERNGHMSVMVERMNKQQITEYCKTWKIG